MVIRKAPELQWRASGQVTWLDDAHYITRKEGSALKVNAATGAATPFIDTAKLEAAFAACPDSARKRRGGCNGPIEINERGQERYQHSKRHLPLRLRCRQADRLTNTPEPEVGESFSPDGRQVAYVRTSISTLSISQVSASER